MSKTEQRKKDVAMAKIATVTENGAYYQYKNIRIYVDEQLNSISAKSIDGTPLIKIEAVLEFIQNVGCVINYNTGKQSIITAL